MVFLNTTYKRSFETCRSMCGCLCVVLFLFFSILPPPSCSCDDVGSAAACSLVDPRDLEGDGDQRTQHNLEKRAVNVGDHHSAVKRCVSFHLAPVQLCKAARQWQFGTWRRRLTDICRDSRADNLVCLLLNMCMWSSRRESNQVSWFTCYHSRRGQMFLNVCQRQCKTLGIGVFFCLFVWIVAHI